MPVPFITTIIAMLKTFITRRFIPFITCLLIFQADSVAQKKMVSAPARKSTVRVTQMSENIILELGVMTPLPPDEILPLASTKTAQNVTKVTGAVKLLTNIAEGNASTEMIALALKSRFQLQKDAPKTILSLLAQGRYKAGIAAMLISEQAHQGKILAGNDTEAQLALLVAARYLRAQLPLSEVAHLLKIPSLSNAVEQYLEIVNSKAAREILWAHHPNQAWIVGENVSYGWDSIDGRSRSESEKKLQTELRNSDENVEVYAILGQSSWGSFSDVVVRLKGNEGEISLLGISGNEKARTLTKSELQELKAINANPQIEELGTESYPIGEDDSAVAVRYEHLRLTKKGGRRVLLNEGSHEELYHQLTSLFYKLSQSGVYEYRYDRFDKIKGLELLYSNELKKVLLVAQEYNKLKVIVSDTSSLYEAITNPTKEEIIPNWYEFNSGKLGAITQMPTSYVDFFQTLREIRKLRQLPIVNTPNGLGELSSTSSGEHLFVGSHFQNSKGIFKHTLGEEPVKVSSKKCEELVVTSDEKWLVIKAVPEIKSGASKLIRLNLQTGQEYEVKLPPAINLTPIASIPLRKEILLGEIISRSITNSYLLDPETGNLQSVSGEFRPVLSQARFPFQPTGNPNEYWEIIEDTTTKITRVGRYNLSNFTFSTVLELPDLMGIGAYCVDEAAGQIYVVHDGNLLRIPLPKK